MWKDDLPPTRRNRAEQDNWALVGGFAALFFVVALVAVAGIGLYAIGVG